MSSRWKSRSKRGGSAGVSTRVDRSLAAWAKLGADAASAAAPAAAAPTVSAAERRPACAGAAAGVFVELRASASSAPARMSAGDFAACAASGVIEISPSLNAGAACSGERVAARAGGHGCGFARRHRRGCCGGTVLEHRVRRVELAAERDGLVPDIALPVADGEELGGDRLERLRLVVLRVDLEQLQVDLLPLRVLLQRILQDLFRLCVAAVREVHLGLGDRVDLVGIDVAETFAAEIAGERVVAGVDHATAGGPEYGVGLDVRARDDAVLELRALAPTRGDHGSDAAQDYQRRGTDSPIWNRRQQVGEEARWLGFRRRGGLRRRLGRRGIRGRRRDRRSGCGLGFRRRGRRCHRCGSGSRGGRRRGRCGCGRRCWRGCCGLARRFLGRRHRRIAQLEPALHIGKGLFQRRDLRLRVLELRRSGNCILGISGLAAARCARHANLVRSGCSRGRAVLDRGADGPTRLPGGCPGGLRRGTGHAVAVVAPVGRLHPDDAARLGRGRRLRVLRRRDRHDRPGAQPVHVVAFERALIAAEERREHLLERHVGGLVLRSDPLQRVAALDGVLIPTAARRRRRPAGRGGASGRR